MDAREKLRRYLEQRREMGETELVLDNMTVEEALRIVSGASSRSVEQTVERGVEREIPESSDWRAALRATGAAPESPVRKMASRPEEPPTPEVPAPAAAPSLDDVPAGLNVGTPAGELFGGTMATLDTLDAIAKHVASCTRCPLYS